MDKFIYVNGARENNLKNVTVKIPHGKHTVVVGVSGSGKSSLVYDVIYAAGQKRLLDCLSETARRYTNQLKQPDVNFIDGLTPVISVKQYKPNINPRSTIGTLSEISTYLRYLYSGMGRAHCPVCKREYHVITLQYLVKELEELLHGTVVEVCFPIYKNRVIKSEDFFAGIRSKGYKKILVDDNRLDLRDWIELDDNPHSILVVAGVIRIDKTLSYSDITLLRTALLHGEGFITIKATSKTSNNLGHKAFFERHGCPEHGMVTAEILPSFFSFNEPSSGCEECNGLGITKLCIPEVVVHNGAKSLQKRPFYPLLFLDMKKPYDYCLIYSLAKFYNFSLDTPFEDLPDFAKEILFYGTKGESFPFILPDSYKKELPEYQRSNIGNTVSFEGIVSSINRYYLEHKNQKPVGWEEYLYNTYMVDEICQSCGGSRLKPQRGLITIEGIDYHTAGEMEFTELQRFINNITVPNERADMLLPLLNEIRFKVNSLVEIGLGYLSLNRRTDTLSGGEYQRVRLAGQIGAGLMGLTYIIDEPTTGLHSADNERIVKLINTLISKGNTVITIEHDPEVIKKADHIIEVGKGAGESGGEIIAEGSLAEILANDRSVIAPFLRSNSIVHTIEQSAPIDDNYIKVVGAKANNLKDIDVLIPLNRVVCLTGISGSGKSTLAIEVLYKAFWSMLHNTRVVAGEHLRIEGMERVKDVYCIDQSAIGTSKVSIPATYMGIFNAIRELFANCDQAVGLGLDHISHYSFKSAGGCPSCRGAGVIDTHIQFLGDLSVTCPVCKGARYKDDVLQVRYRGKTISEVLELTVEAAILFFSDHPYIINKLTYISDLGLEYMKLGQPINTISGGESQRLRLAKELGKIRRSKNMLYILDEPTTGLHSKDIKKLICVINRIVSSGNTVLLIEHNTDIILSSDYIIDMGPKAGKDGGKVLVSGSVSDVMDCQQSVTGRYLRELLGR